MIHKPYRVEIVQLTTGMNEVTFFRTFQTDKDHWRNITKTYRGVTDSSVTRLIKYLDTRPDTSKRNTYALIRTRKNLEKGQNQCQK